MVFSMRQLVPMPMGGVPACLVLQDGLERFVVVAAEQDHPVQHRAGAYGAAQPDDAVRNDGAVENTAVGNHRMIQLGAIDLRARQKARTAENRRGHVEEIEARQFVGDIEVGLEESANGADVLPVTLEHKREHPQILNRVRDDMLAKVGQGIVQQAADDFTVEDVDAHIGQHQLPLALDSKCGIPLRRQFQRIEQRRILGFLHKARDAAFGINLHDAQRLRRVRPTGIVATVMSAFVSACWLMI